MKRMLSAILVMLLLSSCAAMKEMRAKRLAERAAADRSKCLSMGFKEGTDTFRLCLDNRNVEREAKAAKWAAFQAQQKARAAENAAEDARQKQIWQKLLK